MKKNDDFYNVDNEKEDVNVIGFSLIAAAVLIVLVVGVVLLLNRDKINFVKKDKPETKKEEVTGYVNLDDYISGSQVVSDELDIWNEYLDGEEKEEKIEPETVEEDEEEVLKEEVDDTKTKVEKKDGTSMYVNINKYLAKNELDNASFMLKNGRLSYYKDGEQISKTGIIVDKNDEFVDFNKVRKDGVDFVFIKIGQRGYQTGTLTVDEKFFDNLKNAKDAGLHVGVLFSSAAVTVEEAKEEAQFVLDTLGEEKIDYPVCFYMNYAENDKSRIETVSNNQKSIVTDTFCQAIKDAGMCSIVYGDKEWLLCDLNFTSISGRDILLSQEADLPDFPYRFNMWEYKTDDVSGVEGKSELLISFVDYSIK